MPDVRIQRLDVNSGDHKVKEKAAYEQRSVEVRNPGFKNPHMSVWRKKVLPQSIKTD